MVISFLIAVLTICSSIPNEQIVSPYSNNTTALVIKAELINCGNTPPIVEKNQVLLPMNIVKKYFDPNLFLDEKMHTIVTTSKNKVAKMKLNNIKASVNNKTVSCYVPAKLINGVIYVPISFLKNVYGINIQNNTEYNAVVIDYNQRKLKQGKAAELVSYIRKSKVNTSPAVKKIIIGDKLEVVNEYKGWYKVRTDDGIIGFMKTESVKLVSLDFSKSKIKTDLLKEAQKEKINLVWDQSLSVHGLDKIEGAQIVSPTWFYVSDENGTVKSKADLEYVKKVHQYGYKVWGLFSNSFSPIISRSILNDGGLRDKVIRQIVDYAKTYDLDGINIDFENMSMKDRDMFSQFVRELAPMLRAEGMVVSVDVGAPYGSENYSGCYDRKALAEIVDYVAVMTYDQHWNNCPYSGSVAQYSWVEDKLQRTLEEVPSEKLLLGIPFYTRGWKEEIDVNGSTKITQYGVFTMEAARAEVKANNASVRWDNESGQYYAQYSKDNAIYKIWLEDENSVNLKSSLVHKYNLAGVAIWQKVYGKPEAWNVLTTNLQKFGSYEEWIEGNKALYSRLNRFYLSKR